MDVQTLIVALIVLAAAAFVGRRAWATLRPRKDAGCASDCGCGESSRSNDWSST